MVQLHTVPLAQQMSDRKAVLVAAACRLATTDSLPSNPCFLLRQTQPLL